MHEITERMGGGPTMPEFDTERFLDDLRATMQERGKLQADIAWDTGISESSVSRVLRYRQGLTSITTIVLLSRWMGTSIDNYVVGGRR